MKRLAILFLIASFAINALYSADLKKVKKKTSDYYKEINQFSDEISHLNLINALNLTIEQMQKIQGIALKAKRIRDEYEADNSEFARETWEIYQALRQDLIVKGAEVPKELQDKAGKNDKKIREAKSKLDKDVKSLEKEVEKIFTEGQLNIIAEFKNCLIPPSNLKNPSRAGQAYDSGPTENLLSKIRKMTDDQYNKEIDCVINDVIKHEEEKYLGELKDNEEVKEKQRLLALIQKAKAMTDADFLLNKTEMAQEMDLKYKKDQLEKMLYYLSQGSGYSHLGKIGHYFLDDNIIYTLNQKIKTARTFKKPKKNDLDNVNPIDLGDRVKKDIVK